MGRDYYDTLGVSKSASEDELKKGAAQCTALVAMPAMLFAYSGQDTEVCLIHAQRIASWR